MKRVQPLRKAEDGTLMHRNRSCGRGLTSQQGDGRRLGEWRRTNRCDGLPLGVLGVGDGVTDDV
jgi:hypothetical protein